MLLKSSKANDAGSANGGAIGPRLKLYLLVTIVLVLVAAAALLIPRGTPLHQCNSLFFQQNKYSCISQLAFSSNNASLCGMMTGNYSSACYESMAERTGNASLCSNSLSGNTTTGSECFTYFANKTGNASLCAGAVEPYKMHCVTSLSVRSSSNASCSMLDPQNQTICSSSVGMSEAIVYGKANLCNLVSNSTDRQIENGILNNTPAVSSLGGMASYMLTYLLAIPNESISPKDLCYLAVAGKTSNSSLCGYISSSQISQLCTSVSSRANVTPQSFNASQILNACSSSSMYISEKQCIVYLTLSESIETDNITWCKTLGSDYYTTCYSSFASAFKNATYCSYISNITASNACLANMNYTSSSSS